jgi:hypothetical protein
MKKPSLLFHGFLLVMILGGCRAPGQAADTPDSIQPEETASVFLTPTMPPAAATAETEKSITDIPELSRTPTYEQCNQGLDFTVPGDWVLCDPWAASITIINASNKMWQFSYQTYYGVEVPHPCTRLQHITQDEAYLYFSLDEDCILTEPGFVSSIGVFRMDLLDGGVSEVLRASYNFESGQGNSYTVSISPTGRRMAYIVDENPSLSLNIVDLQTGDKRSFRLEEKYLNGGYYSWSEDGTKLAFMLESEANYEYFISMVFLDLLAENSIVTFIKDQDYRWIVSTIEITAAGVQVTPSDGQALFYDIETGVLSPINR